MFSSLIFLWGRSHLLSPLWVRRLLKAEGEARSAGAEFPTYERESKAAVKADKSSPSTPR